MSIPGTDRRSLLRTTAGAFTAVVLGCRAGEDVEKTSDRTANSKHQKFLEPRSREPTKLERPCITQDAKRQRMMEALSALLERDKPREYPALVRFQNNAENRFEFVSFMVASDGELALTLPAIALDKPAMARAVTFFRERGIEATREEEFGTDGKWGPGDLIFGMRFRRDVRLAANTTLEVFSRVHQLPNDFELMTVEG